MPQSADARPEARDDQTGRFATPTGKPRPLSPHLQVWRFHVTMAASICHRITGAALAGGLILVAAWLAALAMGPEAYAGFGRVSGSWIGVFIWFGFSLMLFYHLLSGIRHLVWDTGRGLAPKTSSTLSSLSFAGALLLTLVFWVALALTGKFAL